MPHAIRQLAKEVKRLVGSSGIFSDGTFRSDIGLFPTPTDPRPHTCLHIRRCPGVTRITRRDSVLTSQSFLALEMRRVDKVRREYNYTVTPIYRGISCIF